MNVKVFQFNGCNKCFHETILLKQNDMEVELISNPKDWKGEKIDVAVVSGYLLPEDKEILLNIQSNANKLIAYGDCTTTGGIFGLANQKGANITPISKIIPESFKINGYLDEVHRQIDIFENEEACFNDLGFLCNGYIATECKERCVDYGTQCRGCKPIIDRSGVRMLGMFGTLMGNVEVATEASKYGATDKLADKDDDMTESLPDIVGNFFRFSLPTSGLPKGRIHSKGSILENVFTGRLIEEFPLITGLLGGDNSISMTLSIIEAYEKGAEIEVNEQTKQYRQKLRSLEKELKNAIDAQDAEKYKDVTEKIRKIAGNMNLSNVFYGGFKTPIDGADNFDDYKAEPFEIKEGTYKNGIVEFSIDSKGVIKEIKIKEGA